MADIYSGAVKVRVWLDHKVDIKSKAVTAPLTCLPLLHRGEVTLADYSFEFWRPALDVLRNSYWGRLWVQQELWLSSSEVTLHLRRHEFYHGGVFTVLYRNDDVVSGIDPTELDDCFEAQKLVSTIQDYIDEPPLLTTMDQLNGLRGKCSNSPGDMQTLYLLFVRSEHLQNVRS
jgi:hypothetical protein